LTEERRLRVFENKMPRRIFGPKRDEVTGEWRKIHKDNYYALILTKYYSGDQIKKDETGRARSTYGEVQ
jgi:hypothetical protein